jgi:hypothetical protein
MTKENRLFCKIQSTFALARRKPSFATFFGIADSDRRVVNQKSWVHLKSEQNEKPVRELHGRKACGVSKPFRDSSLKTL